MDPERQGWSGTSPFGYENLSKPYIHAALAAHLDRLSRRAEIRADDVLEEYRREVGPHGGLAVFGSPWKSMLGDPMKYHTAAGTAARPGQPVEKC